VECGFGIPCNKWGIFHRAIDIYPDVLVKTCCILHNFVRQRDGFQFQDTNVPSRVLRLLALEVILQERIWGAQLRGRASLSVRAPLGSMVGGSSHSFSILSDDRSKASSQNGSST
jgi:hypothetical protein